MVAMPSTSVERGGGGETAGIEVVGMIETELSSVVGGGSGRKDDFVDDEEYEEHRDPSRVDVGGC